MTYKDDVVDFAFSDSNVLLSHLWPIGPGSLEQAGQFRPIDSTVLTARFVARPLWLGAVDYFALGAFHPRLLLVLLGVCHL